MSTIFNLGLTQKIERCRNNDWQDNWDFRRFGSLTKQPLTARVKAVVKDFLVWFGLRTPRTLAVLRKSENDVQWLYERLQDDESRRLFVDFMAYRVLGHQKVKLPLNTPIYWQTLEKLDENFEPWRSIQLDFLGWKLGLYDLAEEGYSMKLYARANGIFTQLLIQQYRGITADHNIEVGAGETVIDAGGCYGDTALYFAHKAGEAGRVFSFEFMPNNIEIFQRNLLLNPNLADRVEIAPNPLWSVSNKKLYVEGHGPAAHVTPMPTNAAATEVETLSIDDLVQVKKLACVDFMKMDIEGEELEALNGAEASIRRDCPKLAISVYHKLHDFWTIPLWIDSLGLGYQFYLRHFTIHAEKTVLFAEVKR
jgi:FkbM family methyltransferase